MESLPANNINDAQSEMSYQRACSAINSIKPKDIKELSTVRCPVSTTKFIMDTVHILFLRPLNKKNEIHEKRILKQDIPFVADSYETQTASTLASKKFLKDMVHFIENKKDHLTDEQMELLEPYLTLKAPNNELLFTPEVSKKTSAALSGLTSWVRAVKDYH